MQLVAYGAQDVYLTGNPMITFFRSVYRRHTNFAMETIEQIFNGTVGFGNRVTALIARNGDLLSGMYLEVTLPNLTGAAPFIRWTDCVGHYLLRDVTLEIGGQLIDQHSGDWLDIWAQLSMAGFRRNAYLELIGQDGPGNGLLRQTPVNQFIQTGRFLDAESRRVLYIPLQFYFCRNIGLALPLIALQYHEVKVNITFETQNNLIISDGVMPNQGTLKASLWADYVYLDVDERRRFAQLSHEYLVEQLQINDFSYSSTSITADLTFNHPVKELIWTCRETLATTAKQYANYTSLVATGEQSYILPIAAININNDVTARRSQIAENLVQSGYLKLNGHERFATKEGTYFCRYQPLRHHTNCPMSPGINVFSFALRPEDHQPSGTCNFSRIDNAQLVLRLNLNAIAGVLRVYAVNYNILRIMSGMGGLAYSN